MKPSIPARLVKDFFQRLHEIRRTKKVELDTAFIHWYVATRFGSDCVQKITDNDDGGIDAIVKLQGGRVYVIQSKFTDISHRRLKALSTEDYAKFDRLPTIFKKRENFEQFLQTVDPSLHQPYRELFRILHRDGSDVVWEIATLHSRSRAGEGRLINLDNRNFWYATDNLLLYELSLEGATPPADPISLTFTWCFPKVDKERNIRSYILRASLKNFLDYEDHDPDRRLLARNVRSNLESEINENIKETFVKKPEEFWYSHNGITMVCSKATTHGNEITLQAPSVINGAQTLYALTNVTNRSPDAHVLVRVIEVPQGVPDARRLVDSIIFRTNQQNKMYTYDLRANDQIQVKLATKFNTQKVFYERRRGDWKRKRRILRNQGFDYLTSKKLGQILAACTQAIGGVVIAKKSIENLFSDDIYNELFYNPFEEIFLKYKLHDFIDNSLYLIKSKKITTRERNHALLTCLAITWNCIRTSRLLGDWQKSSEKVAKLDAYDKSCKDFRKVIQDLFKACWTRWRKEHKKDETLTPNNFFKSKHWNEQLLKELTPKFKREIQRGIQKALL